MKIVTGDLLKANCLEYPYIIHQVNCTSIRAAGLAKAIFEAFPWADVYSDRSRRGDDVQRFGQVSCTPTIKFQTEGQLSC
jgi:hypothetical protein